MNADGLIELPLVGHHFRFRRLTWADEVQFSQQHPGATRVDYAASALVQVDDKAVTFEQSQALLLRMPRPVRDRVLIFYMGSLPSRRVFSVEVPYMAPEPATYQQQVDAEGEEQASAEDEYLNRTFGEEEVKEAKAQALEMAKGTNFAGVGPSIGGSVDEEPPQYHVVV